MLKKFPNKCYFKRYKAAACIELLNQIKNLTFVVYGNDALGQLYESLSADLKNNAPVEDNLVAEKPSVVRNQTKKFPPLLTLWQRKKQKN